MSERIWLIAGPSFEGMGAEICILPLVVAAAAVYVVAKSFRLTMDHPPQRRGTLYWIAVAIILIAIVEVIRFSWR